MEEKPKSPWPVVGSKDRGEFTIRDSLRQIGVTNVELYGLNEVAKKWGVVYGRARNHMYKINAKRVKHGLQRIGVLFNGRICLTPEEIERFRPNQGTLHWLNPGEGEEEIRQKIVDLLRKGKSSREVARELGVSLINVSDVRRDVVAAEVKALFEDGLTPAQIVFETGLPLHVVFTLQYELGFFEPKDELAEQHRMAVEALEAGKSVPEAAHASGLSKETIWRIRRGMQAKAKAKAKGETQPHE